MELRKNIRDYIKINPIDQETNVAVGVVFPFNASGVFYSSYTTAEQVKSNLLNVLLTEPGERIFKPEFGVGLRSHLFENEIETVILEERIKNQINTYIPEVELNDVVATKAPNSHQLSIAVSYRVLANNESDTIQINFNTDTNQPPPSSGIPAGSAVGSAGY